MADSINIPSSSVTGRVVLVAAILFAVLFGWYAVRIQIGSMVAGLSSPESPNALPASELAMRMVPGNPVATWLRASVETGDNIIPLFEETVRNSPADYRWRVELGRAYERDGRNDLAERELKRAAELAPSYAFVHWHLGNFYLRQGRNDEAFAELRVAAANNRTYREQVFSLAWDYFDKDPQMVERLAAANAETTAALALFFAARGAAADSLRNWNRLTDDEKAVNPEVARAIALGLFQQKHFPEALEFARQLGIDADAAPETVTNGGFEKGVAIQEDSRFGWQVTRGEGKLDIASDPSVHREGNRSLKFSFRSYTKPDLYNLFQTVVVQPGTGYRLTFWVRTENLKSSGPPLIEVLNANDGKLIATSRSYPTGTNDWQQMTIEFRTPEESHAITIRTSRSFCGDQCPIVGTFWYDDFVLSRA